MRSNSINISLSNSQSSTERRVLSNIKPPIPPKPNIHIHNRGISENKLHNFNNASSDGLISSNYYSVPVYKTQTTHPAAVIIKDDDSPHVATLDCKTENVVEALRPISSDMFNGKYLAPFANRYKTPSQGVLPPLSKVDFVPRYTLTQGNSRTNVKKLGACDKNAMLIEKIRVSIPYGPSYAAGNLPRANSDPESNSSHSVTLNRGCIISINNLKNSFINNYNETDSRNSNNQRRSLNLDNLSLSVGNDVPVPITTQAALKRMDRSPASSGLMTGKGVCHICSTYIAECKCEHVSSYNKNAFPADNAHMINGESVPFAQSTNCYSNKDTVLKDSLMLQTENFPWSELGSVWEDQTSVLCNKLRVQFDNTAASVTSSQSAPSSPATKPALKKSEAVDMEDYEYYKKLSRGISRATDNVNIVSKTRSEIAQGIWEALENGNWITSTPFFIETPVFTFTLPDLSMYSDEFRSFLEKDLIEMATLVSLEAAGRLNWWAMIGASQRLWPLATTGDGNCLLHAASLGLWGFHDRLLTLRKALHEFLTRSRFTKPLWRRWRWQLAIQNKETGLVLSEEEWEAEWKSVLKLASSAPRGGSKSQESITASAPNLSHISGGLSQAKLKSDFSGPVYESLEEIHVFALAHVLRRPIIVVADTILKDMNGEPLAPIPFGGIYLPLECPPTECQRSPLLLTYDAAHFSALVVMESSETVDKDQASKMSLPACLPLAAVIPVSDCWHDLLPIQFVVDPGEDLAWGEYEVDDKLVQKLIPTTQNQEALLKQYLDIVQVPIPSTYLETSLASHFQEEGFLSSDSGDLQPGTWDKKSLESSFDSDEGFHLSDGGDTAKPPRAPTQLQTMVKSFGSIGRSMSKRIKKNLNTLSKFSRSGSLRRKNHLTKGSDDFSSHKTCRGVRVGTHQNFILAATIHSEQRQAYQQEMIENYLATARERFMREGGSNAFTKNSESPSKNTLNVTNISCPELQGTSNLSLCGSLRQDFPEEQLQCINIGCSQYGTSQTSYMCVACFNLQKNEEEKVYLRQSSREVHTNKSPSGGNNSLLIQNHSATVDGGGEMQYGTGKSRFYATLDESSMKNATLIPVTHPVSGSKDKTLFLSNSTFYNDSVAIPSYNLQKGKGAVTSSKPSSNSSVSSRSSTPSENTLDGNLKAQKESLHTVSIDEDSKRAGMTMLGKGRGGILQGVAVMGGISQSRSPTTSCIETTTPVESDTSPHSLSKPCLTSGCEFYGNSATDYLCSKCYQETKKGSSLDSYTLNQVKYVQL